MNRAPPAFTSSQRPDAAALPGPLKANTNNKICLRVSSQTNSRIVLDENGAERLMGRGHLVAKLANEGPSPIEPDLRAGSVP
jgi:S-DNA-T family DNA segregation ATPase FtsK/SpoIIIE